MTWLSRAAVSRRSVTILIAAGLFAAGILAWGSLKQELVPEVSFPIVTVIAPYPGAAAEEVVDDVVGPIENAVQTLEGIDTVNSTSANSIGFVIAQFAYGTDVDAAVADLEDAVGGLELPDGDREPSKGQDVDRDAGELHDDQRHEKGKRDAQRRDECRAHAEEEEEDREDREERAEAALPQ